MGSSFFGIPSMRGEKSSSSSSSSRKNRKSGLDKPKQPQRGLGVAQLEQIRLRTQMACGFNPPSLNNQEDMMRMQGVGAPYGATPQLSTSYPNYSQSSPSTSSTYAHHPNFMMTFGEENMMRYHDSQPTSNLSSTFIQSGMTSPSPSPSYFEDPRRHSIDFMHSSNHISESSDHEEVDLELRLSL